MLAAACSEDGIFVEVRVPAGMEASDVDLYLATAECQDADGYDCSAIVGPRLGNEPRDAVPGKVFYVDDDLRFTAPVDGDGTAWFQLAPGTAEFVKTAVAVGRGSNGNAGVAVLNSIDLRVSPQHVRVDLRAVIDDHVRGQSPALEIWQPMDDRYRCVGAEADGRVVYIVPRQDPDCDEVPTSTVQDECDPGEHLAIDEVGDQLEDMTCFTHRALDSVCLLGDRACDENRPDILGACVRSRTAFCVPDLACECDAIDPPCLLDLFTNPSPNGATHIECTIETINEAAGPRTCTDLAPTGATLGFGTACKNPEIGLLKDGVDGFGSSVTDSDAGAEVTLTPQIANACDIGLAAPNVQFLDPPTPIHTMVKIDVAASGEESRFVILPLKVVFVDGTCDVDGGLTRCEVLRSAGERVEKCFVE